MESFHQGAYDGHRISVQHQSKNWRRKYSRRLAIVDALVVLWSTAGALVLRFGTPQSPGVVDTNGKPYIAITLCLAAAWWCVLGIGGSRESKILGYGVEEYKRVITSSFWLFGLVAIVSYALQLETARGYVGLALPAGLASLFIARFLVRRILHLERKKGESSSTVLIIGGLHSAEHLVRSLRAQPMAGYRPLAVYLPGAPSSTVLTTFPDIPTVGHEPTLESLIAVIKHIGPDAVALSSGVPLPPRTIRELGWALSELNVRMIMAPALTDVAGPRIHTQPISGLPLIHVSTPNLRGWKRLTKRFFDLVAASALIVLLLPALALLAALIYLDTPGPVLFRQNRVGAAGEIFSMIKFRSMAVNAESQLATLRSLDEGNGVMFKMKADPRVTRVGKFIRRFSLDELPQLFNVLEGSMSLVGPRPPLPSEVEEYETYMKRRLLVRPGLTGLWQVSGRSLLSWEDTVRLDLYYVENWSLSGDIAILLKTLKAVVSRHGAY